MVNKTLNEQLVQELIQDIDAIGVAANGDDQTDVVTRLSKRYPSIQKMYRLLFENGGITDFFEDFNSLQESDLEVGDYAVVTDDSGISLNGLYRLSARGWVKSRYDERFIFDMLISHLSNKKHFLDVFLDANDQVYRYTTLDGHMYLPGLPKEGSLQDNIQNLAGNSSSFRLNLDSYLNLFADKDDLIYAWFDKKANFVTAGGLESKNGVLKLADKTITADYFNQIKNGAVKPNNNHKFIMDMQLEKQTDAVKKLFPIALNEDDGKYITKRMPCGIKTEYGLTGFYHQKIEGYDGDGTGSQFWHYIIDIDENLNPTLRSKKLFLNPETPEGVVKHPHLGRLLNGDIMLVFEQRPAPNAVYHRYWCKSTDDGLTWSKPVEMKFTNPEPAYFCILGTVGAITRLENNRLIIPMYTSDKRLYSIYSDDEGDTWTNGELCPDVTGHEPSIIENFYHNCLFMDIRPANGEAKRVRAVSYDFGHTWKSPADDMFEDLDSAANQGTLFKDEQTGIVIQTHNNTPQNRRDNYCLSISLDGGHNFPLHYYPIDRTHYGGYSHVLKYDTGVYIVVLEYDETTYKGVNSYENSGILILNLKEVLTNVTYS